MRLKLPACLCPGWKSDQGTVGLGTEPNQVEFPGFSGHSVSAVSVLPQTALGSRRRGDCGDGCDCRSDRYSRRHRVGSGCGHCRCGCCSQIQPPSRCPALALHPAPIIVRLHSSCVFSTSSSPRHTRVAKLLRQPPSATPIRIDATRSRIRPDRRPLVRCQTRESRIGSSYQSERWSTCTGAL